MENATGLYKAELEGKMRGEDIFDHHAFLRAPTGTEESPCVVESTMEYRVVGSPDPDDDSIIHWGRLEEGAPPMPPSKPDDYRRLFDGNNDDCFRCALRLTRKACKLYSPFYAADLIVGSPLGLRSLVGRTRTEEIP